MEISKGDLVESLAGHDRGELVLCRGLRRNLRRRGRRKVQKTLSSQTEKAEACPTDRTDRLPLRPNACGPGERCSTANYAGIWRDFAIKTKVITKEGKNLAKDDVIELEGIVTDALPNAMFSVDIGNGHTILAHISGKLRMNFIKILPGDKVTVQMSPYDLTRGRITWRSK